MAVLFFLFSFISLVFGTNYYEVLGVPEDVTSRDLTKAFRKLSLQYHPDKNPGDEEAHKKFVEINKAYEILNDEDKRHAYDTEGEEGLENLRKMVGATDIFGRQQSNKGPDYRMSYQVTLEQLYNGVETTMQVKRKILCTKCKGTGAKDGETHTCSQCKGHGTVTVVQQMGGGMKWQMQQQCPKCGGKGKMAKHVCPHCGGSRQEMASKDLEVIIERGMDDGHEIRFARASEHNPGTTPGDVVLVLKTAPHRTFVRRGNDLTMTLTITLKQALLGLQTSVTQLDGREVSISRTGITPPGYVQTIKGEGMPLHNMASEKGNLLVTYNVNFPSHFSDEHKKMIEELL